MRLPIDIEGELTHWLGLAERLNLSDGPVGITFEGDRTVFIMANGGPGQITISTIVSTDVALAPDALAFLLTQNDALGKTTGIIIGADAATGVISTSRRICTLSLDKVLFEFLVKAVITVADSVIDTLPGPDNRSLLRANNDLCCAYPTAAQNTIQQLVDGLTTPEFQLERIGNHIGYMIHPDAAIVCQPLGNELLVSAVAQDANSVATDPEAVSEMMLRNLFVEKCQSGGFFLEDGKRIGALALTCMSDQVDDMFAKAAAQSVGDVTTMAKRTHHTDRSLMSSNTVFKV